MGRRKKYQTEEERVLAQRVWNQNYYEKNKKLIRLKRMEKYYEERLEQIRAELCGM